MIKSVRRNEQPLRDVLTTHNTKIAMPTTAEMEKLQRLETLLEPCRCVTELLGGEKLEDTQGKCQLDYLKIATALDPRFKDLKCVPRAERGKVWASVTNLLKEQRVVAEKPAEATTSEPPKNKLALLAALSESDSEQEEDSIENSVRRYRAEPTIRAEACPLEWWSKYAGSHSRLASSAQKYLATPATSVPCERLFSLAGHIVQKKRVSLSSENVNDLVCLSNWLGAEE
ncbi:hypothetical protein VZT92_026732 [Zoarces viviparus]|uniref:HAT C-terminal dimerisation domain-containing protein n=1 Tax=Zoarces viviparus TaxID=48416 RepID=A0AAW1DUL7_ZOAVI